MRRAMVASQLRTTGVNDARVIAAMAEVPRERFVPPSSRALAYADALVPLGDGRAMNPPVALGRLLTEAHPQSFDRALLIGAGTGYGAAVLARLVRSLVAVEEDEALAAMAQDALADLRNVTVVAGPLHGGHTAAAPYDLILIDGAVELVPDGLVEQLADGGRLATGLVDGSVTRLAIGRRAGHGFGLVAFADSAAAALPGFAKPREFTF